MSNMSSAPSKKKKDKKKAQDQSSKMMIPIINKQYKKATFLRPYGKAAGQAIGGGLAAYFNPAMVPVASQFGRRLGGYGADAIKTLTGYGDYSVKQNVLSPGAPPHVRNASVHSGGIVISHREFLGDIITSGVTGAFKLQSFLINPGLEDTFPWLSQIASNFQEYRIEGMIFEYRSMSADALNSTNTALGSVIMATNYNASDANYASKAEMENSQYGQSIKPSESCVHYIECARSASVLSELYVRDSALSIQDDQRFFDLGKFQIATTGMQGVNVNVGELWVSYQIRLMKPVMEDALGNDAGWARFNSNLGVTNSAPLGTGNFFPVAGSTIAASVSTDGLVLTIPQSSLKKTYIVEVLWIGGSATYAIPTTNTTGSNVLAVNIFQNNGTNISGAPQGTATATSVMRRWCWSFEGYSNVPNQITFSTNGTLPTSVTTLDIFVIQIPNQS